MQFKNKSLLFLLPVFILMVSCSSNKNKATPENLLSKENMVSVMMDIQLADATINLSNYGQGNYPNDKQKLLTAIYAQHKVTKKQFEESFSYYVEHPEEFQKIYDDVISGLSKKQAEMVNEK